MPEAQGVLGAVARVIGTLEALQVPYVVGGSFASGVWGRLEPQGAGLDWTYMEHRARQLGVSATLTMLRAATEGQDQ